MAERRTTSRLADFNREFPRLLARTKHPLRAHLVSVAQLAADLAKRHGGDPAAAAAAGYLHDWLKPLSRSRLKRIFLRLRVPMCPSTERAPALWHGPAAAALARRSLGLKHPDALAAIRWHTTGRPRASLVERAVFVADYCAAGRGFREAGAGRKLATRSLDLATRYVLAGKLAHLQSKAVRPHPASLAFWRKLFSRTRHG